MAEKHFQTKVAKHLRELGCFVMVISPQPGIPNGTADIFFCKEGFYGWIECKARKNAPFQPLQERFIARMDKWSWAKVAYPENFDDIKKELESLLAQ